MTNCCGNPECKRPFGLVRRSWYFEQFCSAKCRELQAAAGSQPDLLEMALQLS